MGEYKRYGVVYADPPWKFQNWRSHKWWRNVEAVRDRATGISAEAARAAEKYYPTMTLDEMKEIPIQSLMLDDCALFMWATWPTLEQSLALGSAWGLTYKTCAFCWAKSNKSTQGRFAVIDDDANWHMGMGYWTRANTEPCLLFTRGKPKRIAKNVRQLVVATIAKHSQKPDKIYGKIESLMHGPYLELFARQPHQGWDSIGNEINGQDITTAIHAITGG